MELPADPVAAVLAYHERTKHHLDRYAAALGHMDWATQPDPWRTYEGARTVTLPHAVAGVDAPYSALRSPAALPPRPLTLENLAAFLELCLGLTAWKSAGGHRWALRANPSSGNLHPTEGYVSCASLPGLAGGVHHYVSRDHVLEERAGFEPPLPAGSFVVGLSSIVWREAWKYGERAWRYCQHDVGHAVASVAYAAATLGWRARLLDGAGDDDVEAILGLARGEAHPAEAEEPEALLVVRTTGRDADARMDLDPLVAAARAATWTGRANRLSASHHDWPVLAEVSRAARATRRPPATPWEPLPAPPAGRAARDDHPAANLIRERRSAVEMDATTGLSRDAFATFVARLVPGRGIPPFDAFPWRPRVHPFLLVHRVEGLPTGLYALARSADAVEDLRGRLGAEFLWDVVPGMPAGVPLFLLKAGDGRAVARTVSCHQDVASDGAFTFGMLAEFERPIRTEGAHAYRRLFWEAGAIGQAAYLEATAAGLSGTGIGCFFDTPSHSLLGLRGPAFQDLYHFTVGKAVEDPRIETLAPYGSP